MEEFKPADAPEQEIFGNDADLWDRCTVTALFDASADVETLLKDSQSQLGLTAPLTYEAGDPF